MARRVARTAAYAFAVLGVAHGAEADPIRVSYQVTLTHLDESSGTRPIDPISFVLSMTFDSTPVILEPDPDFDRVIEFGRPAFDGVPALAGPGPAAGEAQGASYAQGHTAGGPQFLLRAWMRVHAAVAPGVWGHTWTELGAMHRANQPFPTDARSFLAALHASRIGFVHMSETWTGDAYGGGPFEGFRWVGAATPIETAPTPEPATLTLVAAGIAAAAVRRRRRAGKSA